MPEHHQLTPLTRAVLLAAGLLLLGLIFHQLVTLLVAILMTILLAIPLSGLATYLERYRIPRAVGALIALLCFVGLLAGILALLIPPFVDQTKQFADAVPGIVDDLRNRVQEVSGDQPSQVGLDIQSFINRLTESPSDLIGPLASIGFSIASVLGAIVLMVITAFYIAVRPQPLIDGMLALFPPERREWARGIMQRLRDSWVGWMQGVVVDMLITGVLVYVGLRLIDLDFAIFFAVFSALMVLIPYFGSIAGAIPPVLFGLTDSVEKAVLALAVYVLIQQIESNMTIPLVMANRVKLHPALVAIGVVVIGQLFGFIGLFVAVPILCLIVIVVDEVWVKPLEAERGVRAATGAELSGGRAPPAPATQAPAVPPASAPPSPEPQPRPHSPARPW